MKFMTRLFKDWIVPIVIALVVAVLINKFLFYMVLVPTGSMKTTIEPGDRLFITHIYNKDNIQRGNILVFYSDELEKTLVKRVIGLPKDEVEIIEGKVIVNGKEIDEPYITSESSKSGVYQVPENSYLFLGDNRDNSHDSRYWKNPYIYEDKIKGKARFVIFPFNRISILR